MIAAPSPVIADLSATRTDALVRGYLAERWAPLPTGGEWAGIAPIYWCSTTGLIVGVAPRAAPGQRWVYKRGQRWKFSDGSGPVSWVEVAYGDETRDDRGASVTRCSKREVSDG